MDSAYPVRSASDSMANRNLKADEFRRPRNRHRRTFGELKPHEFSLVSWEDRFLNFLCWDRSISKTWSFCTWHRSPSHSIHPKKKKKSGAAGLLATSLMHLVPFRFQWQRAGEEWSCWTSSDPVFYLTLPNLVCVYILINPCSHFAVDWIRNEEHQFKCSHLFVFYLG